jgi:RNA-directed DNA polymerase
MTRGRLRVQRITDKKKMTAKLKLVKAGLRRKRHLPVPEQGRWLASVITGHQAYYAVPGNAKAVGTFRYQAIRLWRHALSSRSQKGRVTWERMTRIASRYLPRTKTVHPWPDKRFAARYP